MADQYLKCEYYSSDENTPVLELRPDEYIITFGIIDGAEVIGLSAIIGGKEWPGKNRDWCIAYREHIITLDENKGLVKLMNLKASEDEKSALVGICDLGDKRISCFTVPLDDIEVR